jgi:hypothetical protein
MSNDKEQPGRDIEQFRDVTRQFAIAAIIACIIAALPLAYAIYVSLPEKHALHVGGQ